MVCSRDPANVAGPSPRNCEDAEKREEALLM